MVDTITVGNFKLTKPEISGSPTTWGNKLNANMDIIDGAMTANQQAGVPVGSITMWAGVATTPPANWMLCNGASIATADYPALFAVIGYAFGGSGTSFNLPNFSNKFPMGGTVGSTGGEATHVLTTAEMASHAHAVTDPTHNHGHSDPGHAHNVYDPTHIHGVGDPGHAHGVSQAYQDAHSHGLDHQVPTTSAGGTVAAQAGGWLFQSVRTDQQQPALHVAIAAGGTGVYLGYAATGISIYASGTGMSNTAAATGVSIQASGGGAAHNNLPPYLGISFIIKYQ